MRILCGDIGGTNARLALWHDGVLSDEHHYPSRDYASLDGPIQAWLEVSGARPDRACLAIAGPVHDNVCRTTNLPWVIDGAALAAHLGAPVRLVNDFFAAARGVSELGPDDRVQIAGGSPVPGAPLVVMGAGTGLGEAFVAGEAVLAGEGGHADFGPSDERERRLAAWLQATRGRASWEDVVSGPGLVNLQRFTYHDAGEAPPAWLDAPDAPARVSREHPDAVAWFCALYGAEAGNLAMKVLPRGGVYLCGGVAPRLLGPLREGGFYQRFLAKGRAAHAIAEVPIYVVTHGALGLLGAAAEARRMG